MTSPTPSDKSERPDAFTKSHARMKALAPDATQAQRRDFTMRLTGMQAEALRLGLPITARALHNGPIRAVGWEMAGDTEKAASYVTPMKPEAP